MARFVAEFYETEKGEQPAREFLLSLDKKMRAKMMMIIGVLQDNGNELREPYSKQLSEGIFELRAKSDRIFPVCCISSMLISILFLQTGL